MCSSLTALVRLVPFQRMTAPSSKLSLATCIKNNSFAEMQSDSNNTDFGAGVLSNLRATFLRVREKLD